MIYSRFICIHLHRYKYIHVKMNRLFVARLCYFATWVESFEYV